jgi:RNA polymerase sigma factor (sigma-70 family)
MLRENIESILAGLSSNRVDGAWKAFLDTYTPAIMQVVRQHESGARAEECFIFACEKLCDDGFRRLLQFDPARKVRFRTWLKLVVSNLCADWRRTEYGRLRPFASIARLPDFDRLLYHYAFELGMTRRASLRAMRLTYPDLTEEKLAEAIGRLHAALTPRQRWQLSVRRRDACSVVLLDTVGENPAIPELAQSSRGPESAAQFDQARKALQRAMAELGNQERLLLRLRYQEGLSLKDVAEVTGLGDLHRAKRRIKKALDALMHLVEAENTGRKRQ